MRKDARTILDREWLIPGAVLECTRNDYAPELEELQVRVVGFEGAMVHCDVWHSHRLHDNVWLAEGAPFRLSTPARKRDVIPSDEYAIAYRFAPADPERVGPTAVCSWRLIGLASASARS